MPRPQLRRRRIRSRQNNDAGAHRHPPVKVLDVLIGQTNAAGGHEINEARAYQNNLIPKARGDARTLLSEAEAYKQQRIAEAVGGASRFLSLQKEYEKGRDITRTRLYLEAVEKILPRVRLYVVDTDKGRVPLHLRMSGP